MKACLPSNQCTVPENTKLLQNVQMVNFLFLRKLKDYFLLIIGIRQNEKPKTTCIIYKPGPDQYIVYWLSRQNHIENKDEELANMKLHINDIDITKMIPMCMTIKDI